MYTLALPEPRISDRQVELAEGMIVRSWRVRYNNSIFRIRPRPQTRDHEPAHGTKGMKSVSRPGQAPGLNQVRLEHITAASFVSSFSSHTYFLASAEPGGGCRVALQVRRDPPSRNTSHHQESSISSSIHSQANVINEKCTTDVKTSKNCPANAPEGELIQDLSALCNAADPE
jgi:hypothetical protein